MASEWMESKDLQMGSQIVEALWALNACLDAIEGELVTSQEAALESVVIKYNELSIIKKKHKNKKN